LFTCKGTYMIECVGLFNSLRAIWAGPFGIHFFFTFRPNCWRYKALSDYPGLQTPIQRFFCMYAKISLCTIQTLQNPNLCKIPPLHHDWTTFAICQHYTIWKICFWFFFCGHDSLVKKRIYSRKLLFVDKPDIYDASVRWVVASAVLWDSSTQPGFTGPAKCYFFGFWFLVCYAATQLPTQLPQRRIQVVRSNKVARKRLTEANGTPAMDFGFQEIRKRRYTQTKNRTKHANTVVI